jgi:type IV pilus assembly protein PilX
VNDSHMTTARSPGKRRVIQSASQRGISLLFALLALAAMMLAAVALVRSVDSGALVLGNLGFKQDATSASDSAAELARAALLNSGLDLTVDQPSIGYYATSQDNLDPTGRVTSATNQLAVVNWGDSDSCACLSTSPATCASCSRLPSAEQPLNGGRVRARWLITRLCPATGAVSAANACAKPASMALSQAAARGEIRIGAEARPTETTTTPFYRIIVRTVGGRGAVSFTETILR